MQIPSYQSSAPPFSADFDVVCVDLAKPPDENPLSGPVNIGSIPSFWQRGRQHHDSQYLPEIKLGSLVVTLYKEQCTHAGIISGVSENAKRPGCIFDTWPLEDEVYFRPFMLHPLSGQKQGALWVPCNGESDQSPPACRITRLSTVAGQRLRQLIGPVAPEQIRTVFWSDTERLAFDQKAEFQERYINSANALLQQLVS